MDDTSGTFLASEQASETRLQELRSQRLLIQHLTSGHLAALEHFVTPGWPGRSLQELSRVPVSVPTFMRVSTPRATDYSTYAVSAESNFRTSSTCAAMRSILRHPGVRYRNLRPLHFLSELLAALEYDRLGPDGLEDTPLALGQLANAVAALREALLPIAGDNVAESSGASPEVLVRLIRLECFSQVQRDLNALDTLSERTPTKHYEDVAARLTYSLRRLARVSKLFHDTAPTQPDLESASLDAIIDLLNSGWTLNLTQALRAATATGSGQVVWSDANSPIARALTWLAASGDSFNEISGTSPYGERRTSLFVADYLLARARDQLRRSLPTTFAELRPDSRTPAHPYVLYWALEGLCSGTSSEDATRFKSLLDSARSEYYRLVARAVGGTTEVDMFRLGFHAALELEHRDDWDRDIARSALHVLEAKQHNDGTWAKRDRMWATERHGDAYGFTAELLTSLLIATQREPDLACILEPCLRRTVAWADRTKVAVHEEGSSPGSREAATPSTVPAGFVWATGLGAEAVDPQAWATAECYGFLYLADRHYARRSAELAVEVFDGSLGGIPTTLEKKDDSSLLKMVGDLHQPGEVPPKIADLLVDRVVAPLVAGHSYFGEYMLAARADRKDKRRSGILFGPPGTGKTTFIEKLAVFLGWPLIRLGPYHFLRYGTDRVPEAAAYVFEYLKVLDDCVVFLDEMEEFVRSRDARQSDTLTEGRPLSIYEARECCTVDQTSRGNESGPSVEFRQRLWTTVFLPLLQDLHDRANVLFFVATNYFERVDTAIARPGRFDFRLNVLPPSPRRKVDEVIMPLLQDQLALLATDADEVAKIVRKVLTSNGYVIGSRSVVAGDRAFRVGTREDAEQLAEDSRGELGERLERLEVYGSDGRVIEAPMPISVRFEWFTRADAIELASKLVKDEGMEQLGAGKGSVANGRLPEEMLETALLRAFSEVVPTAYEWDPGRDLVKWSWLT